MVKMLRNLQYMWYWIYVPVSQIIANWVPKTILPPQLLHVCRGHTDIGLKICWNSCSGTFGLVCCLWMSWSLEVSSFTSQQILNFQEIRIRTGPSQSACCGTRVVNFFKLNGEKRFVQTSDASKSLSCSHFSHTRFIVYQAKFALFNVKHLCSSPWDSRSGIIYEFARNV